MFWFLDNNFSKYQLIFVKLGICIDIVAIWFGIANGQISSFLTVICLEKIHPYFRTITSVKINEYSGNSACALILWRFGLGLLRIKIL